MKRCVMLAAVIALAGCNHYADFTLPPLAGGDPDPTFAFDERPEPVFSDRVDALNPSVVRFTGLTNLYSVFDGKTWSTALAVSDDGLHWQSRGLVVSPDSRSWEGDYIAANGSAFEHRGALLYWYQAGPRNGESIGLARMDPQQPLSDAGSPAPGTHPAFRKEEKPVLSPGPFDSWDERAVADPYVIRIEPYFYIYYLGHDRAQPPRQRIGLARSRDGIAWEKLRSNPILTPGAPGSFDEAGEGEPAVWISHGYYWMLFTGRDFSERRRLGLARSTDGVHWKKLPAIFAGASAWDSKVICDPTVLIENGVIHVWFGGGDVASPDENLHGKIGYATLRPIAASSH
jgi:predicted GH43/DUF377 family glycosyl hydrolase